MRRAATTVLGRLNKMGKPVFTTGDAALNLGMTRSAASRALSRLAGAGLVLSIRRGLWSLETQIDPLRLPEYLTAPFPAYVSLQTALQLHGMISQVPQVIYVASLAPTRGIKTRIADYSVHRLARAARFPGEGPPRHAVPRARPQPTVCHVARGGDPAALRS
jgi:predicted transcriptional regulator of viral defense system